MPNLFVITGPPGGGKTQTLHELLKLGFSAVDEPARRILAEQRAIGGDGVYDKNPRLFCELMLARTISDFRRMSGADAPVFFDRGIPDMVVYAQLFGLETSEAQNAAGRHRYEPVVFVLPSWRDIYVTDDERKMTFEAAQSFGERVRSVYIDLGYTIVDVPQDSPASRARFIAGSARASDDTARSTVGPFGGPQR